MVVGDGASSESLLPERGSDEEVADLSIGGKGDESTGGEAGGVAGSDTSGKVASLVRAVSTGRAGSGFDGSA
jgi:hypothetical protein